LTSVSNRFGRTLSFRYNNIDQLMSITVPDGRIISYGYDNSNRLTTVMYPDGKSQGFLYENSTYPQALTGKIDESGIRWSTFAYDSKGRAVSTELADGVYKYQVSYPSTGFASVIDPLNTNRSFRYATNAGRLAVISGSSPSGGRDSDARSRVQAPNGLISSETDFSGVTTTTVWDAARRLPVSITRASGKPEATNITAQWHSTFSLPTLVTETGRTTAYTYDDRGNVLSQTVTDTNANKAQTWQWAYAAQSLLSSQTEPNGAVTLYEHDTLGNLTKVANALGHVTQYAYDTANRVISETAPNGLVTTYTYDARDRVLTRTVAGQQTTTLTYKPYGKVETITLPTGLVLTYTYDAAHRLTGWNNNRGEQGSFTLDAMGNRTAEQIKDSSGAVAWQVARTINNINRLASSTEGSNQTNIFGYDANGERTSETNGLNGSTRYGLDALRRVRSITDPANRSATLAWNALDAVTQAKDFKGVATTYTRDAQGNATAETSADIGTRGTQYDMLGLPSTIVDALGQATQIQRDLLGRPTSLTFADGKTTLLRYDLTPQSTGYLSEITDRSGTTEYTRDSFGRVVLKRQTLASGLVQQIGYGYAANGQLVTISYPNGGTLTHVYDTTGRLAQLNWNGAPLVTGLTWNPMGQPTAWTWAFSTPVAAARTYDTAARLTATEFSGYVYNAAGRITSLSQYLYEPADTDPTHTSIAGVLQGWNVGYDSVGRITAFDAMGTGGNSAGFGYDANGNRSSSTATVSGQTTSRTYAIEGTSNKLTGFGQTSGGTSTGVAYAYNANGDLLSDGLRTYTYDAEGRLSAATTGATDASPTTRYAHNALGQRVFKTEPLYPPSEGDESDPGFWQSLVSFFTSLWAPSSTDAEKLGWAYLYDEEGSLIVETGTGGANSAGSTQHIYLPTAAGPMPIAAIVNGQRYAVHSDHLNTPRRLTDDSGQPAWQWAYSAFGDEQPTTAANRFGTGMGTTGATAVTFNLRYPGQVADADSGLFYNYFRSYSSAIGSYTQNDPKGLAAGWNRRPYAFNNPLRYSDPDGLNPLAGAVGGAEVGSVFGPVGTVVGGLIGAGAGAWIGWNVTGPMLSEEGDSVVYPDNPDGAPDKFRPISGSRGKQCEDGSVWERDTSSHGGDQWKRWPDRKSWEKGKTPNSIWPDGRIRK